MAAGTEIKRENKKQLISIIIIAYKRKEFILEAIKSVINQDKGPYEKEIIVVKNFSDHEIDNFIDESCDRNILSKNDGIGAKISEAIDVAKGDILTFLEDDDFFHEGKLNLVAKVFLEHKNMLYFHNSNKIIDHNGKAIEKDVYPEANKNFVIDMNILSLRKISSIRKKPYLGLSSTSINGGFGRSIRNQLQDINIAVDFFIFFISLSSEGIMFLSTEKLTSYRVHNSDSNFGGDFNTYLNKKIEHNSKLTVELHVIENKINKKKVREIVASDRSYMNLFIEIVKKHRKQQVYLDSKNCLLFFLRSWDIKFLKRGVEGLTYLLSPVQMNKIYMKNIYKDYERLKNIVNR